MSFAPALFTITSMRPNFANVCSTVLARRHVAQVALHEEVVARRSGGRSFLRAAADVDDDRSFGEQPFDNASPDPLRAAGDDGDFISQLQIHGGRFEVSLTRAIGGRNGGNGADLRGERRRGISRHRGSSVDSPNCLGPFGQQRSEYLSLAIGDRRGAAVGAGAGDGELLCVQFANFERSNFRVVKLHLAPRCRQFDAAQRQLLAGNAIAIGERDVRMSVV